VSTPEQLAAETRAYCEFVRATAASQSAIEKSPWLFADGGVIPVHVLGGVSSADVATPTAYPRILAGAGFSPTTFYRGVMGSKYANAECERYRVALQLRLLAALDADSFAAPGWSAKIAVLQEALPQAQAILDKIKKNVAIGQATMQDLDAATLRMDALQELQADARERLAGLPALGTVQPFPFFAEVGITLIPGWLAQGTAEERASTARAQWSAAQTEREAAQARLAIDKVKELLDADAKRLKQVLILRADLEQRTKALADLGAQKATDYADYVWFDLVRVRSEVAYLTAHVNALTAALRSP
jgi:hypothetical protein